jgi:DNA repair protein RecN (Recombination protein N)
VEAALERAGQRPLGVVSRAGSPPRLVRLAIEDFGLIARAELTFADGFTACTGETGSGKTMLLGALAFALGERASADVVRRGAARARATLELEPDEALRAHFAREGFELDGDELAIVAREIAPSGKSTARINGRPATAAQLRTLGEWLVDRIGQDEQQRLLSHGYQLDVLDRFGGPEILRRREAVALLHARACALAVELQVSSESAGRAFAELEFARFAAREIDDAAAQPGEDLRLRERRDYLANAERIAVALTAAHGALADAEASAVDALGAAAGALAGLARFGSELAQLAERVAALQSDAVEAAAGVARALDGTEFDPGELETTGARLDLIERLKKKYGPTLAEVLASRERFGQTIERHETRDGRKAELGAELERVRAELGGEAQALAALRAGAARRLETSVAAELAALAMPAARFAVLFEPLAEIGPSGSERVEFALAPNPGEPVRALAKAASGGERSRVLLALVVVLAGRRERTALVFDEIDAGIGGATANAVGLRLGALARTTQVVCVTHLAQIAAWADLHYSLRKRETGGNTLIELVPLEEQRAVPEEIARMLSGSAAAIALEHAATLIGEVRSRKAASRAQA